MPTTSTKQSFWGRLLDLISPRPCPVCGRRLAPSERPLCGSCLMHLPLTSFETSPQDNQMARLFWGQLPIERATSLFYYEPQSEAGRLIRELKYNNHPEIGYELGAMFANMLMPTGFFEGIDAVVPVPLANRRQRQRGYNQSMELARGISEATRLPVYDKVACRTVFTQSQTRLDYRQRRENVENVFELTDAASATGKHLLLVDDIVTTGATCIACGKVLVRAGGVRLSILSLGYAKS